MLTKNKKYLILSLVIIFLFLFAGNIFCRSSAKTTGKIIESMAAESDKQVAERLKQGMEGNVNLKEKVGASIKEPFFENKMLEFDTPEGKIELEFDLLDYGVWAETNNENEIEAEDFDIEINESENKYKWGYNVKLKELDFMAKINVKLINSENNLIIIDNQTLKIGNYYLSFADLTSQNFSVKIGSPVVLSEINLTSNLTQINITETNETNISESNLTLTNLTEINVTEVNVTEVNINESENNLSEVQEQENETIEEEDVEQLNETQENTEEINETGIVDHEVENETAEETQESDTDEETTGEISEEVSEEQEITEESVAEPEAGITGTIIQGFNGITGFVVNRVKGITNFVFKGIRGLTGRVIEEEQSVSIYVQKNFNGTNVSVGDVINLDPVLIIIEITKAQHLDDEKLFVEDIYDNVKEKDNNWTEAIPNEHYVRIKFEENLTKDNDITVYARSVDNESNQIEVYLQDGEEVISKFENIQSEDWYKIYLTNLSDGENYDIFDLKILGYSGVEFDYIVDPIGDNGTATDGYTVFRCGTINQSGVFTMNQSITDNSLSTDCINITISDVVLDCAGYFISSDDAYAGVYANQNNVTIENCNISMGASGGATGIKFEGSNNSLVYNNTLSNQNRCIHLSFIENFIFENNTLSDCSQWGFFAWKGDNHNITGNIFNYASLETTDLSNSIVFNNIVNVGKISFNQYAGSAFLRNNTIDNNIVGNTTTHGISASTSGNNITNNQVTNCTGNFLGGIYYYYPGYGIIENNTVESCYYGIYLRGTHNLINNNSVSLNREFGIYFEVASNNNITGNNIVYNLDHGIKFWGNSQSNIIIDNNISFNGNTAGDLGDGINFEGDTSWMSYNVIENNTISNNYDDGIRFRNKVTSNNITNNNITQNDDNGVSFGDSVSDIIQNNIVSNNKITNNDNDGLHINEGADNNTFMGNNVSGNGNCVTEVGDGIAVNGGDYNRFENNTVSLNCDDGIELDNSANYNSVLTNTVNSNTNDGIHMEVTSDYNIIDNNNVSFNGDEGMQIETGASHNTITNNFINSNNDHGIKLVNSTTINNTLSYNIINGSGRNPEDTGDGINLQAPSNIIFNNTVIYGADDGIKLTSVSNNNVSKNIISHNGDKGINIITSVSNKFYENYATFNSHGYYLHDNSTDNVLVDNTAINNSLQGVYIASPLDSENSVTNAYTCCNYGDYDIYDLDSSIFTNTTCNTFNNGSEGFCDNSCIETCSAGCNFNITSSYTMDENKECFNTAFTINADNILFDCANYSIRGPNKNSHSGIYVGDVSNVTIKNCFISNFERGVYFNNTQNSFIFDSTFTRNHIGIGMRFATYNLVNNSKVTYNGDGIEVEASSYNNFSYNLIDNNVDDGIQVELVSSNNIFLNNTITNNGDKGIKFETGSIDNSVINNTFENNSRQLLMEPDSLYEGDFVNVSLEIRNLNYGGVVWLNPLTFSFTNLSAIIKISSNSIFVNSSAISALNSSANLTFYNTNSFGFYSWSRYVLRNGEVCPASICTVLSNSDTFIFRVTHFTDYSISGSLIPGASGSSGGISCIVNWQCSSWSNCVKGTQTRSCVDFNACGTTIQKPAESQSCESSEDEKSSLFDAELPQPEGSEGADSCISNWQCSEWGNCMAVYNLEDIVGGKVLLKGIQERSCTDKNRCSYDKAEKQECSTKIPVYARKIERCYKDYIEIFDYKDVLISRLELVEGGYKKLNVQMLFDEYGYCPYCFDGKRNYDEDEADCSYEGESCPRCAPEFPSLKQGYSLIPGIMAVLALLCFLFLGWYLVLRRKAGKRLRKILDFSFEEREKFKTKRKSKWFFGMFSILFILLSGFLVFVLINLSPNIYKIYIFDCFASLNYLFNQYALLAALIVFSILLVLLIGIVYKNKKIIKEKKVKIIRDFSEQAKEASENLGDLFGKGKANFEKTMHKTKEELLKSYKNLARIYKKKHKKLLKLRKKIIKKNKKIIRREARGRRSLRKRRILRGDIERYKRGIAGLNELKQKLERLDKAFQEEKGKGIKIQVERDIRRLKGKINKKQSY